MEEKQTFESVVEEMKLLNKNIRLFHCGGDLVPAGFSYNKALMRLHYLQHRKRQLKRFQIKE